MTTIYKYKIPTMGPAEQFVLMPTNAQILSAQAQHDAVAIWAIVDPSFPMAKRRIITATTGSRLSGTEGTYLATLQFAGGGFVLHVFDGGWMP